MIPLIGILLCIYLVFKGFEIFQIAWCAPERSSGVVLGAIAITISVLIAALFGFMFISSSLSVPSL